MTPCPKCGMTSHNRLDASEGYCGNCHAYTDPGERVLAVVVVYRHPKDYPDKFVVRRQWACRGGAVDIEPEPLGVVDTLDQTREAIPVEMDTRLPRDPDDDPCIVECWV